MDPQSPPKRMTRARAAAKATTEPACKTARIVTAATKAKATRGSTATAPTSSSNNKRKVRPDDAEEEDSLDQEPAKPASITTATIKPTRATRGRPKKTVDEPAPEPATMEPVKATRGRPKKVTEPAPAESTRTVRATRAKKTKKSEGGGDADVEAEPPKKATRGRPAASTVSSRQAVKPAVKKTVKFEEPEKENIAPPAAKGSTKASTSEPSGLRARPMRRPGVATGRTARGGTKSSKSASASDNKGEKPLPLSPKKVNQLTLNKAAADSDDELAMNDKPPGRSLMKNPIKPPVGSKKAVQPQVQAPPAAETDAPELDRPESTVMLGSPARRPPPSPWKNSIKTPAKRVEGILAAPAQLQSDGENTAKSPFKMSLLQSPAKRVPVMKSIDLGSGSGGQPQFSPMKMSLLSSPAKRVASPMKSFAPLAEEEIQVARTPAPKPTLLATPLPKESQQALDKMGGEEEGEQENMRENSDYAIPDSPTRLRFPGRLSAVLPRHVDPVFKDAQPSPQEEVQEDDEQHDEDCEYDEEIEVPGEPMALDEEAAQLEQEEEEDEPAQETNFVATASPIRQPRSFRLRDKDLQSFHEDSGSEDELSPEQDRFIRTFGGVPSTPCPTNSSATPRSRTANRSTAKRVRMDGKFGFTPLADQLNGWTAGPSPLKTGIHTGSPAPAFLTPTAVAAPSPRENKVSSPAAGAPVENHFFEDEMMIRPDAIDEGPDSAMTEEPVLDDISFTEEDIALAAEANEMSLMEPEQIEELIDGQAADDSVSEASQEYGDENAIPIDPTLMGTEEPGVPLVTPRRVIRREFHTVSKVPLKPAAEETPRRRMKTRSHSISRVPVQRPTHTLNRSATVISYSPTKKRESSMDVPAVDQEEEEEPAQSSPPPTTPQKTSEVSWSTMGTPARTPRRDIDPALLRGAVVFIDVHTSEGADASGIFVELLTQMGARCVKSWNWNPSSPPGNDRQSSSNSKVGITHVVYKDGGKRTLEKVRECGGVVQCVGVSWVLDCERENEWLDEAPYYIDTSLVPRGGARRRKSMEPRALANLNGMVVPTPKGSGSNGSTNTPARTTAPPPATPSPNKYGTRRRESALWVRTPEDSSNSGSSNDNSSNSFTPFENDDVVNWDACILTPVPKTPAPEAVARYAANVSLDSPTDSTMADDSDDEDGSRVDPLVMPSPGSLMTRTCPPKANTFREMGAGILQREKDEGVLMRLMAARRKSLQFAPKVASPLSKAWY